MLVPTHLRRAFPRVPTPTDWCVGIGIGLGSFVGILPRGVRLWGDDMVGDKVTVAIEACE